MNPPLAASSWPFGALLALPALAALFFLAFKFARNTHQRVVNMLLGVIGSFAAMIAVGRVAEMPGNRWLLDEDAGVPVSLAATAIGAVIGVGLSLFLRKLLSLVMRKRHLPHGAADRNSDAGTP